MPLLFRSRDGARRVGKGSVTQEHPANDGFTVPGFGEVQDLDQAAHIVLEISRADVTNGREAQRGVGRGDT